MNLSQQVVTLLLVMIICLGSLVSLAQPTSMLVNPPSTSVALGDTFTVIVQINAVSPQQVDGGEVHLNFDPSVLQVVSLTAGTSFSITLLPPSFDNTLGHVDYAAGSIFGFPTGLFDLLTIEFRAIAGSSCTGLTYEFTPPARNTSATRLGLDILDFVDTGKVVVAVPFVSVSPKVLLQGAEDSTSTLSRDDLRMGGYIPAIEPYTGLGYIQQGLGGGESLSPGVLLISGNNALVDWVFLELREAGNPANVVATTSALVQRDGDVVAGDGVSAVTFQGVGPDSYYLAIKHRNHLSVMSANTLALTSTTQTADFTNPTFGLFGTDIRLSINGTSSLAIPTGDGDRSGTVDATDRTSCWTNRNVQGYVDDDYNLSGDVSAADRIQVWNNRSTSTFVP